MLAGAAPRVSGRWQPMVPRPQQEELILHSVTEVQRTPEFDSVHSFEHPLRERRRARQEDFLF